MVAGINPPILDLIILKESRVNWFSGISGIVPFKSQSDRNVKELSSQKS